MGAFDPSAHALFLTVGHSRPGRGGNGMAGRPAVAGGSRSSGGRRHRVKNGRPARRGAGARASVTGPGPECGRDGGPGPLRPTEKRKVDSSILSLTTVLMRLEQPSYLHLQQEERDSRGAGSASGDASLPP